MWSFLFGARIDSDLRRISVLMQVVGSIIPRGFSRKRADYTLVILSGTPKREPLVRGVFFLVPN